MDNMVSIELTKDEIESILYAIGAAEDEGYDSHDFPNVRWADLRDRLEDALKEEVEDELVDEDDTPTFKDTDFINCLMHFEYTPQNEWAVKNAIWEKKNGASILVVYDTDNTECNAIDLLYVAGIVNFIHIMPDTNDVLVEFKVLNTPMGKKVSDCLKAKWEREKDDEKLVCVTGNMSSGRPIYDNDNNIIGFQMLSI